MSVAGVSAQGADPNLLREAEAVRAVLADAKAALAGYTWTEYTEVLVDGKVHSTEQFTCRYNAKGEVVRTLKDETAPEGKPGSATSNKPRSRSKAAKQDYIERAISLIRYYVPPNPDRITAMLQNGTASMGPSEGGKSEIRFQRYFMAGDSMVFKYDSATKALIHVSITSFLGDKKDPVTLEADFGTLQGGVAHLDSTTLDAKAKKVQVKTRNLSYQKVSN
jgi:hypothetical protein